MIKNVSLGTWLMGCLTLCPALVANEEQAAQRLAHFESEIRPVLISKCIQCHGAKKQEGGLRLDSAEALLTGGDSGAAIEIGKPQSSILMEALKYESFEMPPTGQLSERTIAQFEKWIASGAEWPEHSSVLREESGTIAEEDRQWWAFQPVVQHPVPAVQLATWPRNDIDRFVLKKMEDANLTPAPMAEKTVLIRRLYFDLLGLPPTPAEVASYLTDDRVDAWEQLVQRLLNDPRYGEHWARHWLDLVRYSESDGWNQDAYRPEIWRYRDYVVNAFNSDKPYPEFVLEQLAGDELKSDDPQPRIAAGFLRLGIYEYNQRDARGHWNDIMNEMTDVCGDVFLGLSMACARCHDHKFDPLPQRDYFKLRAFFEPVIWRDDIDGATAAERKAYQQQLAQWEEATAEIRQQIAAIVDPYHERKWKSTVDKFPLDIQACFQTPAADRTSWDEQMAYLVSRQFIEEGGGPLKSVKKEDQARLDQLEAQLAAWDELKPPPLPNVMTVANHSGAYTPTIIPDDPQQAPIDPGFLTVMSGGSLADSMPEQEQPPGSHVRFVSSGSPTSAHGTQRRTQLARWIGDARNPLTSRVIVNRIWQQHFGEGIVATSNDFGRLGSEPSHPELLDWLSASFVEHGWSFKELHRQIVTSATWQQSSQHPRASEYETLDPNERLLWRARVRRLQAEQIRDAMLVASGELQTSLGGPSVDEESPRRGLYVKTFRNNLETFLHSFDMANGLKSVAVRDATTTPTQALLLFNGKYGLARAEKLAERILAVHPKQPPAQLVEEACWWTWGRPPNLDELDRSLAYLGIADTTASTSIPRARLVDLCHVLLNSNEFLYLD
jgi:mono/diheme cytochrome c family protein